MLVLASTDITAFHILGGLLALWAVVLSALGVMRHDFPGKGAGQTVVMAISGLLVVGAVASAILTATDEPKGGEEAGAGIKAGPEGTSEPESGGGTAAPGTGADAGQESGGQGQEAQPGATVKTLVINADPSGQLMFDKDQLQAPKGTVRITMNNPSPVGHNVALEGQGLPEKEGPVVEKGGASEVEAALQPGSYTYFCSVPGHREAGMEGTLTVK